jgi:hypothetical protein
LFWTTRIVFFPINRSGLGTSGDTLRTYHKVNGAQTFEPDEEFFVMANGRHLGTKISGKMPALPRTCAKILPFRANLRTENRPLKPALP